MRPGHRESERRAASILRALAGLRAPSSIPLITGLLDTAARHQRWDPACTALETLTAFGPEASSAQEVVRALTAMPDPRPQLAAEDVRSAAVVALAAIGGDPREVLPPALSLIADGAWYRVLAAVKALGRLGPAAVPALPQLRELAAAGDVYAATVIWDIAGEAETQLVLDTLLPAWKTKDAYAGSVIACLNRMGPAAEPALPQLRAWLARPERGGDHNDNDEDLQHLAQRIVDRF